MKIICITEHKESSLIGSIWDIQDLEAKCVMPGNSQYLPGYKVQKDLILYGLENFYVVENLFDWVESLLETLRKTLETLPRIGNVSKTVWRKTMILECFCVTYCLYELIQILVVDKMLRNC